MVRMDVVIDPIKSANQPRSQTTYISDNAVFGYGEKLADLLCLGLYPIQDLEECTCPP